MNICFIGNSVSAQKDSYREALLKWMADESADSVCPINCSLGGIGSLGISFFINRIVQEKPVDLCFIETFVADAKGATPIEYIESALRGIIENPCLIKAKIIPLILYRGDVEEIEYTTVLNIYLKVFESYGFTAVNVYAYVAELIRNGSLRSTDVVYDQVHTTVRGSSIYAEFIYAWIKQNFDKCITPQKRFSQTKTLVPVTSRSLGEHLLNNPFEWKLFRKILPYFVLEQGKNAQFTSLNSGCIGLIVIADSDTGVVNIRSADKLHSAQIYDSWCDSARIQVVILPYVIPPHSKFQVEAGLEISAQHAANLIPSNIEHMGKNIKIVQLMTVDAVYFEEH